MQRAPVYLINMSQGVWIVTYKMPGAKKKKKRAIKATRHCKYCSDSWVTILSNLIFCVES